jgi:glycopeptide antibiotics resistance protein
MPEPILRRRWPLWVLLAYAIVVGVVVLSPVSFAGIVHALGDWLSDDLGLTGFGTGWIEFIANIVMFVPLGFLLTLVFRHPWWGVLLALVLSAAVEVVQIVIPSRQASLRDVLANVLGAAVGALLAWLVVLRRRRASVRADAGATAAH